MSPYVCEGVRSCVCVRARVCVCVCVCARARARVCARVSAAHRRFVPMMRRYVCSGGKHLWGPCGYLHERRQTELGVCNQPGLLHSTPRAQVPPGVPGKHGRDSKHRDCDQRSRPAVGARHRSPLVCLSECMMDGCIYACMRACIYVRDDVYMHACMHACNDVCNYVCMYVCM